MQDYTPNLIDKMRESRFCRALFAAILTIGLCLPSALLSTKAYARDYDGENFGSGNGTLVVSKPDHASIYVNGQEVQASADAPQEFTFAAGSDVTVRVDADNGYAVDSCFVEDEDHSYISDWTSACGDGILEETYKVYGDDLKQYLKTVIAPEETDPYANLDDALYFEAWKSNDSTQRTNAGQKFWVDYKKSGGDSVSERNWEVAFCYGPPGHKGPGAGTWYKLSEQPNEWYRKALSYVMWYGAPYIQNVAGHSLTKGEAHDATQLAVWMVSDQPVKYNTSRVPKAYAAAKDLVAKAKAYANGGNTTPTGAKIDDKTKFMIDHYATVYKPYSGKKQTLIIPNIAGYIDLQKESANKEITDGNECYSLEGAKYGVFLSKADAEAERNLQMVLTTDENGYAVSDALPVKKNGDSTTYYVKEMKHPEGYALDDTVYPVDVKRWKVSTVNADAEENPGVIMEEPQNDPINIFLAKKDENRAYDATSNEGQAGAPSLAFAKFEVKFYPTLDEDYQSVEPVRAWVVQTDSDGFSRMGDATFAIDGTEHPYKVSGDEFYRDINDSVTLPLGTYTFQEIEAPEGYQKDDTIIVRAVTGTVDGDVQVHTYNTPIVSEVPKKGGIEIEKRDLETNELTPQGGASLDGTQFAIVNENDKGAFVDGIEYQPGEVCKILTIENGVAATSDQTLPYGDYSIQEIVAGKGYNLTDGEKRYFTISENHQLIHYSDTVEGAEGGAFKNAVIRGDLKFIKVRGMDQKLLGGIPFKITSKTTGESHIVVTDENGEVNTSADWNKHTQNTNGNDGGEYNAENGLWFGTGAARDDMGALPYDTYTLEELECDNNKGMVMVTKEFTINRQDYVFDMRDIVNDVEKLPYIGTHATDASDGDKLIIADTEAVINDHVSYAELAANETYTLTATLMDKTTGEAIEGASAQVTFETASDRGSVEVQIPVNLVDYAGKDVVVYEVLSKGGAVVAEHQEINDSEQTLHVIAPVIGTTATDDADGDHKIINDTEATIIDTVRYENLVPGKEYTATGTLMVKSVDEDGDIQATELLDKDGNPITVTTQFTPKSASGSIDVVFVFDASMLEPGTQIVVFEKVLRGDVVIASHEDPTDSNQTVETIVPEIGTTAVDGVDGDKNVVSDKGMRVVDTIAYENLVVGKEYTATGKLMEKVVDENGNVTERELTDDHGNTIEAKATFTPTAPNGEVEVEFVFDGYNLDKGTQIVAFEEVFDKDKSVAVHADINDENQLVEVVTPEIGTSAYDAFDLDGLVIADRDAKIIDTVKYENLIPGKEYTVGGIVMDKTTGMPLLSGEGADEITDGELATFMHGLATLLGISDDEFAAMTATGSTGATSEFIDFVGEFTDRLGVENPLAGFTDRIVSDVNVNADVVSEYLAENAKIVNCLTFAQKTFTPNTADGSVDMTFAVNTEGMDGKELVVYELMFANDVIQASHADITDKGQTVEVVSSSIGTTATDKTDGDHYLLPSTDAVVVDTVDYENLVPGKEYTLKGWLMDKATGKQLVIDDKPVTSEIKFTPNNTSGKVDIEFAFDASKLADGAELVAFEELYKDNVLVAEHKDIDDEGQTVTIGEPPVNPDDGDYAKTGEDLLPWIVLAIVLLVGAASAFAYGVRKRKANKSKADAEDSQITPNE